jgi:transposase
VQLHNYARYKKKLSLVMRQDHKAGEKCFVDYSGNGIDVVNPRTGEITVAQIFVGVLGASSYTFAYATPAQDLPSWLDAHVKMYEFFGGVTPITVPDNCKTAVSKVCRYDPELNRSYQDLAEHYGTCVVPARPYRPRDKGKVETAVLVAQRWIVAVLRNRLFHSIAELNAAIRICLERINSKVMRHLKKSRRELFLELDRPALKKLPAKAYELALWQKVRLNIDYHVEVDQHYYSAPYGLVQVELWTRITGSTVEIFHRGNRVASHLRSYVKYKNTTLPEHMPPSHQAHAQWTPSRIIKWAQNFGPACAEVVARILESKSHPELGYRSALGLIRFEKKYSAIRLERACSKALAMKSPHYQTVKTILKNFAEDIPLPGHAPAPTPIVPKASDKNIRGKLYFN